MPTTALFTLDFKATTDPARLRALADDFRATDDHVRDAYLFRASRPGSALQLTQRLLITYDATHVTTHVTDEPVGKYLNDTFVARAVQAFPDDYLEFNSYETAEKLY